MNDSKNRIQPLLEAGTKMFGAATSNFVSSLIAGSGPEAALVSGTLGGAGVVVSMCIEKVGGEISKRWLSPQEEKRVGYVLAKAVEEIIDREKGGETLREDWFSEEGQEDRSEAMEVLENVLLKSQREVEEKKLPYMAHLFANLAFDARYNIHMSHHIIKNAEHLSYRQMCLLHYYVIKDKNIRNDIDQDNGFGHYNLDRISEDLYSLFYEYTDLCQRGYIGGVSDNLSGGHFSILKPHAANIESIAQDIYTLMRLHEIPEKDIAPISKLLGW